MKEISRAPRPINDSMQALVSHVQQHPTDDQVLAESAIELAAILLQESQAQQAPSEKRQGEQMARMMDDPAGKAFTLAMADQVFRPVTHARSAAQFRHLVDAYGVPAYLNAIEQVGMSVGATVSAVLPGIVMPAVTAAMRQQSSSVILPSEQAKLKPLLQKRYAAGMRMNLNQLGEAILGEAEAEKRMEAVLARIASEDCDYLSVKISAIFSQIHLVGYEETLVRIQDRLRRLYRAAQAHPQQGRAKFVNLDMEEYRDLELTCAAFQQVLDEPEFLTLEAGIVLQAYLPDSWPVQKRLSRWARERISRGGVGIKIRIVKGANLAMEAVESELHDWELAPYASKAEVDANYKRMVHEGCKPENAAAVRIGVASHNLFDISYAMLLREREGVAERIEFEMLEGMANHQARTVFAKAGGLLLYAPVVSHQDFHSAIAYLMRRLDENTSPENFLHDLFGMSVGDAAWNRQKARFLQACAEKDTVFAGAKRQQNRATERHSPVSHDAGFHNAPDTDWALRENTQWARALVSAQLEKAAITIPLVIQGREIVTETLVPGEDPSRPAMAPYRYSLAGQNEVELALQGAVSAREKWQGIGHASRAQLLRAAAAEIANSRGEAIAIMVSEAGKSIAEADAEISEAIDFANYYAAEMEFDGAAASALGTVLITPPWNFPYAIPCGGVVAALVAGNTVIFKPAPESVLTAWTMVQALWRAGIPQDVLQFIACPDDEIGRSLVTDSRVDAVILTGAYETARLFLGWKPSLTLFAETSGKNSLIITAAADPDQAVKDLIKSAFGHAGQKCSAASLAIVEAEIYDHPGFLKQLKDAAESLIVGAAGAFDSIVTPIIRPPNEALLRALTTLDAGETWLLEPKMIEGNPCLWSPGIKLGITHSSWFRQTECFGPVLGLMRARDLDHAISLQNDSEFGLTGGIHTLDDREISLWKQKMEVGNAYINRPITGAIVQRQPFGGWKRSCFGYGAKAGGPNYVAQLMRWENAKLPSKRRAVSREIVDFLKHFQASLPESREILQASAESDAYWDEREFSIDHDPTGFACEANVFRYVPFEQVLIRADERTSDTELARLILRAKQMRAQLTVSIPTERAFLKQIGVYTVVETEQQSAARIGNFRMMVRAPKGSIQLKQVAIERGARWNDLPVLWNGRWESVAWFREQAISETLHRYGNLIPTPQTLTKSRPTS